MRKLESFLARYRHYRSGHILVLHLGRWESFRLALKRVNGEKK